VTDIEVVFAERAAAIGFDPQMGLAALHEMTEGSAMSAANVSAAAVRAGLDFRRAGIFGQKVASRLATEALVLESNRGTAVHEAIVVDVPAVTKAPKRRYTKRKA
jgi:hypothetical protein